ncbi:MAG: hypothetical protein AAF614_04560 [Chloroflexota bacterium]
MSDEQHNEAEPRRWPRILGMFLIAFALLAIFYMAVAYFAWQNGQAIRIEQQRTEAETQLGRQISLAEENIAEGSFALALTRLDWILERAPNNAEAIALQQEAQEGLNIRLTPIVVTAVSAQATSTPTATPEPTATPGIISNPDSELSRIRRLSSNENWVEAIPALVAFQNQFPNVERTETNHLLYDAYVAHGLELVQGERVEVGMYYFEQAEQLGDLPIEAIDYQTWAELYTQGIAFSGVNWGAASYYFRDLCLAAPFYQASCDRLVESLIAYGDLFATAEDWCPAEIAYREAWQQQRSQTLTDKLNEAAEGCLAATPTPEAGVGITNTETITNETGTEP